MSEQNKVEVKVGGNAGELKGVMAQAKDHVLGFKESVEGINHTLASMKGAIAGIGEIVLVGFGVEKIAELAREAGEYGEQIEKASKRTGLGVEAVQELQFAFKQAGIDSAGFRTSIQHLSTEIEAAQQGAGKQRDVFRALGIDYRELKNLRIDEVIKRIATAFQNSEDGAAKNAIAVALFGRSAAELVPLLDQGAGGLEAMAARARELGVVLSEEEVKALSQVAGKFKEVDAVTAVLKARMGVELAPVVLQLATALTNAAGQGGAVRALFDGMASAVGPAAAGISYLVEGYELLGKAIVGAFAELNAVLHGDFQAAHAMDVEYLKDITATSDAWEKFRADLQKPLVIPKPEKPGAGGEGGSGKGTLHVTDSAQVGKDLAAQQQVEAAYARSKLDALKETLREESAANDLAYRQNLITIQQYYTEKLRIAKAELQAEHDAVQAQRDAVGKLEKSAQTDAERLQIKAKEIALDGQLAVIEQRMANAADVNADQRIEAERRVQREISTGEIEHRQAMGQEQIARQRSLADQQVQLQQMSAMQRIQVEKRFENEDYQLAKKTLEDKLALLKIEPVERARINNQLLELEQRHADNVGKIEQQAAVERNKYAEQSADAFRNDLGGAIQGLVDGTKSLGQTLRDFFKQLLADLIRIQIEKSITENLGSGTTGGAFLSSLFGGGKASGGYVAPNMLYEVAERGPETLQYGNRTMLLTGSRGGYVQPNGGGGQVVHQTNHFTIMNTTDRRTQQQIATRTGAMLGAVAQRGSSR